MCGPVASTWVRPTPPAELKAPATPSVSAPFLSSNLISQGAGPSGRPLLSSSPQRRFDMFRKCILAVAGLALGMLGIAQHAAAGDHCFQPRCCEPCEPRCCDISNKICVPSTEIKKVAKKCYDSKCDAV